jgi:hypothetical protein
LNLKTVLVITQGKGLVTIELFWKQIYRLQDVLPAASEHRNRISRRDLFEILSCTEGDGYSVLALGKPKRMAEARKPVPISMWLDHTAHCRV